MPENDDRDDARGPFRRRRDEMQEYGFMSEADVERIARRLVAEQTAKFLTADEIDKRIDQRSAQRWRVFGFNVPTDPYEISEGDETNRKAFDHMRGEHQKDVDRRAKPFATAVLVIQLGGGLATFGGIIWAVISFLTGHFAWKG